SITYSMRNGKHRKTRKYKVVFVGTEDMVKKIHELLSANQKIHKYPGKYEFEINGANKLIDFYNLVYKDANFYLDRKHKIFQEMVEYLENRPRGAWNKGLTQDQY